MRFSTVTLIAALSSVAFSQGLLDSLPKCARDCFGNDFGGCNTLDVACICGNTELISGLSCCISQGCSKEEADATIGFAAALCSANGVTVPTAATCAASSASSTRAPSSSASGSMSVSSGSAMMSTTVTGSAASAASASSASSASRASVSSASSASAASASAPGSTGAAALHTAGAMGLAMAGLLVAL